MWIEVFKTGKIKDSQGKEGNYTKDDLETIVKKYNERSAENNSSLAPIVKGHPKDNDPAYGWVEKLERKGNKLIARIKDLVPEFTEELKKKMYRKVSISLYPDMMLRHIGFLGAVQPAVKGLKTVEFSDSDFTEFVYESKEDAKPEEQSLLNKRVKELEKSNTYLSKQFSEKKDELEQSNKKLVEMSYQSFVKEEKGFIDKLLREGKMLPKEAEENLEMLVSLRDLDEGFSFTENQGSTERKSLYKMQRGLLDSRNIIVPLEEEDYLSNLDYHEPDKDFSDIDLNDPQARKMLHEKAAEISIRDHCNYTDVLNMLISGSALPQHNC